MRALGCNEVSIRAFVFVCFVACFVAACAEEEYPTAAVSSTDAGAATPDVYVAPPTGPRYCTQSRAESLPARLTAMSTHASVGGQVVLVSQLFDDFQTACGQCHGTINSMGGFQIATPNDFTLAYIKQENVVSHITSNIACPFATDPSNPQEPMPPCGQHERDAVLAARARRRDQIFGDSARSSGSRREGRSPSRRRPPRRPRPAMPAATRAPRSARSP